MHRTGTQFLWIFIAITFLFSGRSIAQEKKDSTVKQKPYERSLILSIDYSSDKIFYGRKSEERVVYISPSLLYEACSGFYAGLTSYRLIKPEKYWDDSQFLVGWDFTLRKKLKASASYSRFAYNDSSVQIQSSLKNNVQLDLFIDSTFFQPRLTGGLYFGDSSPDYFFSFDLSHEFGWEYLLGKKDGLYIKPTAMISAGTLHYYHLLRDSVKQSLAPKEVTHLNLSGLDFSLPVEYDIGRFIIGVSVNYNIPLNQPKYLKAEPGFYFTAGLGFRFI